MESSQKLPKVKATWSYELRKSFIDLCMEQVENNEKVGTFFSKDGWKKICEEFNRRNDKNYDKKQLKNHWDSTKADWKIWYKLKDFETGLGWDYEKNTVTATDEWWNDYTQKCREAIKFRIKGIEFADQLTNLFLEGMATGKSAWAPSGKTLPNDNVGPCKGVGSSANEPSVDLDSDSPNVIVDLDDGTATFEKHTKPRRRNRKVDNIPPPEPRRRTSSGVSMIKQLDRISDMCEAMVNKRSNRPEPPVIVKDCIKILGQMEEDVPKGSSLYLFACRLFLKQEQRDMFEALEEPSIRLQWIQDQENEAK